MTERLTSVRFEQQTLDALKLIAQLHETSVAAEIRKAVAGYVQNEITKSDFESRLEAKEEERKQLTMQRVAALADAGRLAQRQD